MLHANKTIWAAGKHTAWSMHNVKHKTREKSTVYHPCLNFASCQLDRNFCLICRKQRVVVCGSYSNWTEVISGILQGSVLGLTLFILYVNDLPDHIQSFLGLFADDTKVHHPIISPIDINLLQQDSNLLLDWCGIRLLSLNFTKYKHMSIGPKSSQHVTSACADIFFYTYKGLLENKITINSIGIL